MQVFFSRFYFVSSKKKHIFARETDCFIIYFNDKNEEVLFEDDVRTHVRMCDDHGSRGLWQ
jgi:hypothetical protein